jgi:signal transduction histidine kinase
MSSRPRIAILRRARRPRRSVRLRLTAWYGGLFLLSGAVLLAVTYALVVQALVGNSAGNALCQAPGTGCHHIGARQALDLALQQNAVVLGELRSRSELALGLLGVLSVASGWLVAGRALRPLEASFNAQRQFVANAAHELRTPLARQRVISQVALADPDASVDSLRAAHERVLASGAEQQRLIDALLTLARGQACLDQQEPFDLADLAGPILAVRAPEARQRNLTLSNTLGQAPTAGSPQLAEQLIANLVDNALRHNCPGGLVDVATECRENRAVLTVTNTGPEVPAAAVDRLFQPFQRLTANRISHQGLGLGLSIVEAIADAHQAGITARPRPDGGLTVEVAFPLRRLAAPVAHDHADAATLG